MQILIVEDHVTLQECVSDMLKQEFHLPAVVGKDTVKEALQALEWFVPDVILLDVGLPDMDGIEALPQLGKKAPNAQIVMLTGQDGREMRQKAFAAGAVAYVPKDEIGNDELTSVIRKCMEWE